MKYDYRNALSLSGSGHNVPSSQKQRKMEEERFIWINL
jgi:hypothetical protein